MPEIVDRDLFVECENCKSLIKYNKDETTKRYNLVFTPTMFTDIRCGNGKIVMSNPYWDLYKIEFTICPYCGRKIITWYKQIDSTEDYNIAQGWIDKYKEG